MKSFSTQKTSGASRLAFAIAAICSMQQSSTHAESQTVRVGWYGAGEGLIPGLTVHDACAHSRIPMDMMRHG